jgi:hypothetical protein
VSDSSLPCQRGAVEARNLREAKRLDPPSPRILLGVLNYKRNARDSFTSSLLYSCTGL